MATKQGKFQIAQLYLDSGLTMEQFSLDHSIARSTLFDYQKAFKLKETTGMDTLHDRVGRPAIIDKEGEQNLAKLLADCHKEQRSPNKRSFTELVAAEATNTKRRRGIGGEAKTPSWHTVNRLKIKLQVTQGQGQTKTHARIAAESDPRNAYSMICMVKAFCDQLSPEMIGNWDATQFVVQSDGDTTLLYIKNEDTDTSMPLTTEGSGELGIGIKLYHFHNANGNPATPVFVVADESMDPEEFKFYKVPGLGNMPTLDNFGYKIGRASCRERV
jgi:hypothetical protein